MNDTTECIFADKSVTFDRFVEVVATKLALKMHQIEKGQLEITQAKAYKIYGRADVERWKKSGLLTPSRISPGRILYKITDLNRLANVKQNYLIGEK